MLHQGCNGADIEQAVQRGQQEVFLLAMTQRDKDAIPGQGIPSNGRGCPSSAAEVQEPQTLTVNKEAQP